MKTHQIKTSIRLAFENIKVMPSAYTEEGGRIGAIIAPALQKGPGVINRPDWNASLSFRTAKMMNAPAFDKPAGRMAYDAMCAA